MVPGSDVRNRNRLVSHQNSSSASTVTNEINFLTGRSKKTISVVEVINADLWYYCLMQLQSQLLRGKQGRNFVEIYFQNRGVELVRNELIEGWQSYNHFFETADCFGQSGRLSFVNECTYRILQFLCENYNRKTYYLLNY